MSPVPLHNILFLDIETVAQYPAYDGVPEEAKALWTRKANSLIKDRLTETPETVYSMAGIYAEFGKIVCISCGFLSRGLDGRRMTLKSFYGEDERALLIEFCEILSRWATGSDKFLCAHNGKEFDYPYLCRRMIIHGMTIPNILTVAGKKRWEVPHLDTLELWKFGDYKNFTSLNLLAYVLGIPSPKDDIDGSMVNEVFWKQQDLPRIAEYCQKDVFTTAQVYLRLHGETLLTADQTEIK